MLQRRRLWIAAALLAGGCFGLWRATAELRLRWFVREVQARLPHADPAERDALTAQLIECGPHGWSALAQSLAADDPAVRGATLAALLARIADWESSADSAAHATLLQFAVQWPELAHGLDERGQSGAAVVARRLLVTRLELPLADRQQLLAACAETLRLPGAALPPEDLEELAGTLVAEDSLPALDQPSFVARGPAGPESVEPAALPPEAALEPLASLPGALAQTDDPSAEPQERSATSNAPATVRSAGPEVTPLDEPQPLEPTADSSPLAAARAPSSIADSDLEGRLAKMPAAWAELLRAFARSLSDEASVRTVALTELRQRLVTERELNVAAQLHAPDSKVRREWVRALLGLRGIDGPFWLTWMCTDPDASVRRTAVEVAATAQNPELWQRVSQLAQGDPAAAIRQLATTLEAQRATMARGGTTVTR